MASFCMECGARLVDGEEHVCGGASARTEAAAAAGSLNGAGGNAGGGKKADVQSSAGGSGDRDAGFAIGLGKESSHTYRDDGIGNGGAAGTEASDGGSSRRFESSGSSGESGSGQQRGGSSSDFLGNMTSTVQNVDRNIITRLLQNPLSGLQLDPAKDMVYGWIGMGASLVGFLVWAWLVGRGIIDLFTFGGFGLIGGGFTGRIFLIGLISLVALIGSMWVTGMWQGRSRQDILAVACRLGSMQLASGAGFFIAGILALVTLRLSLIAYGITALVSLIVTVMGALELFNVAPERRFSFIGIGVSLYWILTMLLAALVL